MVLKDLNLYNHKDTQKTYRSIVAEIIELYGIPIRYVPKKIADEQINPFNSEEGFGEDLSNRSNEGMNEIYGEDVTISYELTVPMKATLENYDGYDGVHNMFTQFGYSMEDEISLNIEIQSWRNLISRFGYELDKPEEGDLIIFEMSKAKNGRPQIFEVKYCNESASYFAFGELMVFALDCVLWEYNHEKLNTGDEDIDRLNIDIDANVVRKEIGDNNIIEEKSEEITTFDPNDPFGDDFD